MPVINVNSCKHLLETAVKFEAFFKCCLRICTLPIKQNIYVSIAACMQISFQSDTANDKRNRHVSVKVVIFSITSAS